MPDLIVFDALAFVSSPWTGIAQYTYYLIQHLLQEDAAFHYRLFYNLPLRFRGRLDLPSFPGYEERFRQELVRLPWKVVSAIQRRFGYPDICTLLGPIAIYHSTTHRAMMTGRARLLTTVCDLTPFLLPQYHRDHFDAYRAEMEEAIRKAVHLIAISENTKKDIIERFAVPADRISVTPLAASPEFYPREDEGQQAAIREKYGIRSSFLLYTGTLEPRKNLPRLLDAFARLPASYRREYTLVLAGVKGWKFGPILEKLRSPELKDSVLLTGYVDRQDLPVLMSAAAGFVYPSLYEGFGLPPLEAMSCGTPVITSRVSSLPEVVGDAAILVDPESVDEIAGAMKQLLDDRELGARLRRMGLEQARRFTWQHTAQLTLEVYRQILGR